MSGFKVCQLGLMVFFFLPRAWGSDCGHLLESTSRPAHGQSLRFEFEGQFPAQKSEALIRTVKKVYDLLPQIDKPQTLRFKIDEDVELHGGAAILYRDEIWLPSLSFQLSPKSFEALVAHEITHLIVARNFKDKKGIALHQKILAVAGDMEKVLLLTHSHDPFAELLCDIMSVIVLSDPKAITGLLNEIAELELRANIRSQALDEPRELSLRDFSVPYGDQRWASFRPKDLKYSIFNRFRAYLWQRWLTKQTPEERVAFYLRLQNFFASLFNDDVLLRMGYFWGKDFVAKSNDFLIEHLEETRGLEKNSL